MESPTVFASATSTQKTKKAIVGSKKPKVSSRPPYIQMISDAVISLKEKNGSSAYAIAKFIQGKQSDLPSNFKKLLFVQLKRLVAVGRFVKVKNSFKISATLSKPKLLKKKADSKQIKESDKPKIKVGSKRKTDSSDMSSKTTKIIKSSVKTSIGKKSIARKGKKPVVGVKEKKQIAGKVKKPAGAKVKKPKSLKFVAKKVQIKNVKKI